MTATAGLWKKCIDSLPLIPILRGVEPHEVVAVGQILIDAGYTVIEVPLNSPQPFKSIKSLVDEFGAGVTVGAGTVLSADDVLKTIDTGAQLIVAPNFSEEVAAASVEAGMIYCPGVATPTEAFNAINHGATACKLFPAEMITPAVVKAMFAVLPQNIDLFAVGGITADNMRAYLDAGCTGFGIGSALYKPGKSAAEIKLAADKTVAAFCVCSGVVSGGGVSGPE